jgi:putative endonuclease
MNRDLGQQGETLVASFLKDNGYDIVMTNYRNRFGEIDIIAKEGEVIFFVEVKTRTSDHYGDGLEAITASKRRTLIKLALSYLQDRDLLDENARFDVVAVSGKPSEAPTLEIIKNAFELTENKW